MVLTLYVLLRFVWLRSKYHVSCFFIGDIEGQTGFRGLVSFTYDDLKAAAKNFSDENKIGQGGFSSVYKVKKN